LLLGLVVQQFSAMKSYIDFTQMPFCNVPAYVHTLFTKSSITPTVVSALTCKVSLRVSPEIIPSACSLITLTIPVVSSVRWRLTLRPGCTIRISRISTATSFSTSLVALLLQLVLSVETTNMLEVEDHVHTYCFLVKRVFK
jgi:hypothetical protein